MWAGCIREACCMGMALSHLASMKMMPANTPYAGSAALQTSTGCMLSCALAAWLPSYVCLVCAECTKIAALLPLRQARKISMPLPEIVVPAILSSSPKESQETNSPGSAQRRDCIWIPAGDGDSACTRRQRASSTPMMRPGCVMHNPKSLLCRQREQWLGLPEHCECIGP